MPVAPAAVDALTALDLIIAKILAGRPKDLGDARGLWRARGREMDAGRIESILNLLEEALGRSDLTHAGFRRDPASRLSRPR